MARMHTLGSGQGSSASNPSASASPGSSSETTPGGRRQRSVYTSQQIAQLETYFSINEYIDGERKRQLSLLTNIPEQQIKVWFQNRRQKKKREMEEQQQQQMGEVQQQRQQQQRVRQQHQSEVINVGAVKDEDDDEEEEDEGDLAHAQ